MANVLKKLEISDLTEISAIVRNVDEYAKHFKFSNKRKIYLVKKGKYYLMIKHKKKLRKIHSKKTLNNLNVILDSELTDLLDFFVCGHAVVENNTYHIFWSHFTYKDTNNRWYLVIKNIY